MISRVEASGKDTGHFTQLVWKATGGVGCGREACDGRGKVGGWFVVCEYWPPGKVEGEYESQVQKEVGSGAGGRGEGSGGACGYGGGGLGVSVVCFGVLRSAQSDGFGREQQSVVSCSVYSRICI